MPTPSGSVRATTSLSEPSNTSPTDGRDVIERRASTGKTAVVTAQLRKSVASNSLKAAP